MENRPINSSGWTNSYSLNTLEKNWNEERFDKKFVKQITPILNVLFFKFSNFKYKIEFTKTTFRA